MSISKALGQYLVPSRCSVNAGEHFLCLWTPRIFSISSNTMVPGSCPLVDCDLDFRVGKHQDGLGDPCLLLSGLTSSSPFECTCFKSTKYSRRGGKSPS